MKVEKVVKAGIKREVGFLYFIDKDGDIFRVKMPRGSTRRATIDPVARERQTKGTG